MKNKYLYYYQRFGSELYRSKVTRETDSNIWIENYHGSELMVSRRKIGIDYLEETPEILERYLKDRMKRDYFRKLESLQNCINEDVIKQVLLIEIPKQ